ncbi:RHS repeat-associated core domain-containing protein [Aliamphritea ceti]|uniref:RHS repeat-associated core domain-containing protein n=1 Tax=Aliamphritea ceti TaxID=1524258 RepID=UPI0021C31B12|nr:RHS repeat-associated core domain-containing protein [Aliamphritea ceti]
MMQSHIQSIEEALAAYPDSLNTYRKHTEEFFGVSLLLPSLKMDRKIVVGENEIVDSYDENDFTLTAVCPESGELVLVSKFESVFHVPIGDVKVDIYEVGAGFLLSDGDPVDSAVADKDGRVVFTGLKPRVRYRFDINGDASDAHLTALFSSYDGFIQDNYGWLQEQWGIYKPQWAGSVGASLGRTMVAPITGIAKGIWGALKDIWEGMKAAYNLLKDPYAIPDKLLEGAGNIRDQVAGLIASAPDAAAKALLFASDEAALFLLVKRTLLWMSMIPPDQAIENTYETITQFVVTIAIDIALGLVLTVLGGALGITFLAARIAVYGRRFTSWFLKIADAVMGFFKELSEMVVKYADNALNYRKVAIRGNKPAAALTNGNELHASFDNKPHTSVDQNNGVTDKSDQGTSGSGDPIDSNACTKVDGCPVSMVTGEELLELEDARLSGLIQLPFARTYRSSNCENSQGMGFGWTHSLSHQLRFIGGQIEWHDHQGRMTPLANPEEHFGVVTNRLAGSTIFLGKSEGEYILTSESVAPYFYHFKKHGTVGYLSAISDHYQNRLDIRYDSDRRITRVESEHGTALGLQYHGLSSLISSVDLLGREHGQWISQGAYMRYEYNAAHQLIKASNAQGEAESYEYDEANVIQRRHLAGGAEFYWQWQGEGKAVRAIRHWANFEQMDTRYEWGDDGSVVATYHDGSSQTYQHDDNARLVKQVDPDGAVTEKVYGEKGELLEETDPLGHKTEYKYDSNQQLAAVMYPDGTSTGYEYTDSRLTAKHEGTKSWYYGHNEQGDLISETDPLGHTVKYSYNEHGLISSVHYPDGSVARYSWNRLGQLVDETAPDGGVTRYRYDCFGRRIWQQSSVGGVTEYGWDSANRLISVREPGTRQARIYSYNAYGKVTAVTDEQGQTTRYEYAQPLHLVTAKINPDGSRVEYKYDNAKLFLSEIRNERGERCLLDYHPNGLIAREQSFDGRVTHYGYDLNGHLTEKIEQGLQGSERVTVYERDAMGQLVNKTLPDGNQVAYHYDQYGQLAEVDDGHWPLAYTYDPNGQLLTEHQGWGTFHYSYDAMGRMTSMRLPDHQQLDYDYASGQLTQLNLNGEMLTRHHHQAGREQFRQQGQLTSHYQYDDQGRLSAHTVNQRERHATDPAKTVHHQLYKRTYGYSENGNLLSLEDSRKGRRQYHYDALNRLQQVSGSLTEQLIHDPAGNLLDGRGEQRDVSKGNRLAFKGDRHYQYDEFGNLAEERRGTQHKLISRYEYDCQHRLIKADLPDGSSAQYRYDVFGRRISKTVNEKDGTRQETAFLWQGDKLVAEVNELTRQHTSYVYEPYSFKPMAMLKGSGQATEVYYYQLDHLGTPQELTDSQGKIVWSAHYRAYGQLAIAEVEEILNPIRFQGQYHDLETGLYYNRHRYYDPHTARFTTIDPIGLAGGLNNYQYVPNPTGWVDPLGLASTPGDCPGRDTSPYNAHETRQRLEDAFGAENVQSTTVPNASGRMVHMAGKRHPVTGVPYDSRGFPIFDDIAKYDTKIPGPDFSSLSYTQQMQAASRDLAGAIERGAVNSSGFSDLQLSQIRSGSSKVDGYTWHHHQDFGRMQLLPSTVHSKTGHIGGERISKGI